MTVEELFERIEKGEDDEDSDYAHLKLTTSSFEEMVDKGLSAAQLVAYLEQGHHGNNRIVAWTSDDCCLVLASACLPLTTTPAADSGRHSYAMDITLSGKTTVKFSASNFDVAAPTVIGLLQLCSAVADFDVTFKLFATNPRQPFPTLPADVFKNGSPAASSPGGGGGVVGGVVRFQFCALDEQTVSAICCSFATAVELRQCTVEGLDHALSLNQGPQKLTVSCNMPELGKFVPGLSGNDTLQELELLLHFWLQGEAFENFAAALRGNKGLKRLTVRFLDINDASWGTLVESVRRHPTLRTLDLAFTENFVDNFRRLTAERRAARTKAVADVLQENTKLLDVTWPDFQQDESIMAEVNACLERNRKLAEGGSI